jgi:hypothetical protein
VIPNGFGFTMAGMRVALIGLLLFAPSCAEIGERPGPSAGRVEGQVLATRDVPRRNTYLFLERPNVSSIPMPLYASAVPRERWEAGDARYVFANVQPNVYRLRALMDTEGGFRPDIDVLAQANNGVFLSELQTVTVQRAMTTHADVSMSSVVTQDPPAFEVFQSSAELRLPAGSQASIRVQASVLPPYVNEPAFRLSWGDQDKDGRPDDVNGDGLAEAFPQWFLRRRSLAVPEGEGEVLIPLVLPLSTYLLLAALPVESELSVQSLTLTCLPGSAQNASIDAEGRLQLIPRAEAPVGEYELWVLAESGQFWKVPNMIPDGPAAQRLRIYLEP